ncbi:MAG: hypothetical protein ACLSVX_13650 [Massilimicrobiota timonensis]
MKVKLQVRNDSGWKNVSLNSGVTGSVKYRVINGICYGRIQVEYEHTSFYDNICTIPIKPAEELSFVGRSDDRGETAFAVGTSGTINTMKGGNLGRFSLTGTFSFIVE